MNKTDADRFLEGLIARVGSVESLRDGKFLGRPRAERLRVLAVLLEFGCKGQSVGAILSVREMFGMLPADLARDEMEEAFAEALDIGDEWEFRRFLELIERSFPGMLSYFTHIAMQSSSEEIRELGRDFVTPSDVPPDVPSDVSATPGGTNSGEGEA